MLTFDLFWQQLYDHGASLYHKHDCFDLWATLTPNQQQQLHDTIAAKLRDRRFVDYNPLRAMRDNLRQPMPQPCSNSKFPLGNFTLQAVLIESASPVTPHTFVSPKFGNDALLYNRSVNPDEKAPVSICPKTNWNSPSIFTINGISSL